MRYLEIPRDTLRYHEISSLLHEISSLLHEIPFYYTRCHLYYTRYLEIPTSPHRVSFRQVPSSSTLKHYSIFAGNVLVMCPYVPIGNVLVMYPYVPIGNVLVMYW